MIPIGSFEKTFFPHGARVRHLTKDYQFGGSRKDSTIHSVCGRTYTRWLWGDGRFSEKPVCEDCKKLSETS